MPVNAWEDKVEINHGISEELTKSKKEYGIVHYRYPDEVHRGPWTEEAVDEWLRSWHEDGGGKDVFTKVSREVGPWVVEDQKELGDNRNRS